jgi:hypothetical protein
VTEKMAGKPGFSIIDRASLDKSLKEQNFQNSDRSSADTAARIGKIAGAGQIVLVQVTNGSYSTNQEKTATSVKTLGTAMIQANARLVDVETGVILAEPSSSFQDSVVLSETKTWPILVTKGGDPKVLTDQLWTKATDVVTADLVAKLTDALSQAPAPKAELPLVAGIANGSVFINEGTTSGIKNGDRFQITRMVSVGLKDPKTQKDIVQKQKICTLVIANADESNSSGTCEGGTPKSGDIAEPIHP